MEWNTPVTILPQPGAVTHHHRMMLFGSCFAEYMGARLHEYHFPVDVNPFGIQYNPFSIASSMERLIGGKPYGADELFREGNLWHSFAHHSVYSHTDRDLCLQQINRRFLPAADLLRAGALRLQDALERLELAPHAINCRPPVLNAGNWGSARCATVGFPCSKRFLPLIHVSRYCAP